MARCRPLTSKPGSRNSTRWASRGTSGIRQAGITNFDRVYTRDDLCRADVIFAATGVTGGSLLAGIKREPGWITLETILMRSKSGSIRQMTQKSPVK